MKKELELNQQVKNIFIKEDFELDQVDIFIKKNYQKEYDEIKLINKKIQADTYPGLINIDVEAEITRKNYLIKFLETKIKNVENHVLSGTFDDYKLKVLEKEKQQEKVNQAQLEKQKQNEIDEKESIFSNPTVQKILELSKGIASIPVSIATTTATILFSEGLHKDINKDVNNFFDKIRR